MTHHRNSVICFLLGVSLTVCDSRGGICHNHKCPQILGANSQCCNVSGGAICSLAKSCFSACRNTTNCSQTVPSSKCQPTGFTCVPLNCSKQADCPPGFYCHASDCIPKDHRGRRHEEETNPAIYAIPGVVTAIVFCCCCNKRHAKRRANPAPNPTPNPAPNQSQTTEQTNAPNTSQTSEDTANVENATESDPARINLALEPSTPDAIQDSGPPAYYSLTLEEPEAPPPSYDEAVRQTSQMA